MNQSVQQSSLLAAFGSALERVDRAVASIKSGGGVIVVDDENRENEGDLIFAADSITPEQMNTMIRHGSGIVCLVLDDALADALDLPPMVRNNTSRHGTAFTVSIEAKEGVTTGVSAADRAWTIRTAVDPRCTPADLARPGHVFPLRAHRRGLLGRRGHTEATLELARMAGRRPAGVLCEIMNPDGTMARLPQLVEFAASRGLPVVSVEDLVKGIGLRAAAA